MATLITNAPIFHHPATTTSPPPITACFLESHITNFCECILDFTCSESVFYLCSSATLLHYHYNWNLDACFFLLFPFLARLLPSHLDFFFLFSQTIHLYTTDKWRYSMFVFLLDYLTQHDIFKFQQVAANCMTLLFLVTISFHCIYVTSL